MNNIAKGSVIALEIKKTGINGEGIGYYNKIAVFVPGAMLKEVIYCKITETNDKYLVGEIDSFIHKSKKRVEPFCKFYKECGACTLQHVAYKEQLKIKKEILIDALKRYIKIDVNNLTIHNTVPSEELNYRNKSSLPFRDTNFGLALGLYAQKTNKFVYIDSCAIQNDLVNMVNKKTLSLLLKYNESTTKNKGVLKYLVVRGLEDSNEVQVTFVLSEFKDVYNKIAKELIDNNSEIKSVAYTIQDKNSVDIFGSETVILEGKNYIKDKMLGLSVRLSPKSFYQLNKRSSELLYKEILDHEIKDTDIVFDAYSGIGILGMLLAKKAKHVYSIDFNSDSIKNARIIARENDIKNITFFSDRIETRFQYLEDNNIKPNIIVLDPPRSGLDKKVIESLRKVKSDKILYVSCNVSSLAKNLNSLIDIYDIEYMRPYDFFTETALVETLVSLKLKDSVNR